MSYPRTIEYLYGLQKHGMKFGLDNIRRLLSLFDDPQKSFRSVHVAGTNGKGSTSAMVECMLRTADVRTGLFTSPHLISFTERIRVNGEEIGEDDVIALAAEVRTAADSIDDFSPTFFEVVTAMAFLHFKRSGAEWAVIETGLGGRLDATNVVVPEVAVLARIGLDHCEFLGRTLEEVASEKAGIIKDGIPVVTAGQDDPVMKVLEKRAAERGAQLYKYGEAYTSELISETSGGISLRYEGKGCYEELHLPLAGRHQAVNAATAIKVIEVLMDKYPELKCDVSKGLGEVRWPGRLEMINERPPVLIDGAHNPQAALALSIYLKEVALARYNRIILIAGVMGDKDMGGILDPLLPLASEVLFASPAYGRSAPAERLASFAASKGYPAVVAQSVADALGKAEEIYLDGDLIVVTGSFYTIGEAKEFFGNKGVLTRLRE